MHIKTLLLSSIALVAAGNALAQDKLYKRNGDVLDVKVKEVGTREISYKRASNAEGPTYIINKSEIERIEYENGSEDVFMSDRERARPDREAKEHPKVKYGRNIIAIAPLQVTEGVGLGLSYERVLDKKGIISFYLPATIAFNTSNNSGEFFPGGYYNNYGYPYNETYNTYYVMPGIKIYPTGSKGKVRYAVGPSLAFVFGKQYNAYYPDPLIYPSQYPYYLSYRLEDRFAFGMMINNSLNIQPTPHLYLGLELGLGVTYIQQIGGVDVGTNTLGQFAFKVGYRF